jgi:hypothetical protein
MTSEIRAPGEIPGKFHKRTLWHARNKGRWPVPYAIMFIAGVSGVLWILIILGIMWLIG